MRTLGLAVCLSLAATAAWAQDGARYIDPSPVNFERPFQHDAVRVREAAAPRIEPIPIESWLANGRKIEGLRTRANPPAAVELDAEALQKLFKDVLPRVNEDDQQGR